MSIKNSKLLDKPNKSKKKVVYTLNNIEKHLTNEEVLGSNYANKHGLKKEYLEMIICIKNNCNNIIMPYDEFKSKLKNAKTKAEKKQIRDTKFKLYSEFNKCIEKKCINKSKIYYKKLEDKQKIKDETEYKEYLEIIEKNKELMVGLYDYEKLMYAIAIKHNYTKEYLAHQECLKKLCNSDYEKYRKIYKNININKFKTYLQLDNTTKKKISIKERNINCKWTKCKKTYDKLRRKEFDVIYASEHQY